MEINPPISGRTTEGLLEIIKAPEQWQPDVVAFAQKELNERGIPYEIQVMRRKSYSKFQRKIDSIKVRSSYTTVEKLLIVLFGPILFIIFTDFFLFDGGEGYKKKNRQGRLFLLSGIMLWFIILYLVFI